MANKIGSFLEKHKYAIAIYAFFVVYSFVVVGNFSFPTISNLCYLFHLVDFSIGITPELLPGAVYNAIFPTTSVEAVNLYVNILYFVFMIFVSIMLEKFLYKFDSKNRYIAFIIILFFITGPSTFSIHTGEIGMLDMYWLFLAALFIAMVQNKYLKWFVPVIFVVSIVIHVGAAISFIPLFALIVLFEASQKKKINKSYIIIFAISILLALAVFVFFVAFEDSNLILSRSEFRKLIGERDLSEWGDTYRYYEYVLYRIAPDGTRIFPTSVEGGFFAQVMDVFLRQLKISEVVYTWVDESYFFEFVTGFFVSLPLIVFLYKTVLSFFKKAKENKNKLQRFIWFCTLCLLPFTLLLSAVCSPDLNKWFGHAVICLFTLVLYGLYKAPDNDYLESLNNSTNKFRGIAIAIYFVIYMLCTVETYT